MKRISFMSANYIARQLGFHMSGGWGEGDKATQEWFSPLNTFEERFSEMLSVVAGLSFQAIDIYTGHVHWKWATPAHLIIAKRQLSKHGLKAVSYAGFFGATTAEFEAACQVCVALDLPVLGGLSSLLETDRQGMVKILRRHGLVFALENHPEKSAEELLEKLGEGDEDVIGVTIDFGWFGTNRCDPLKALRKLGPRLKHVHLKDVTAKPEEPTGFPMRDGGHGTCELGKGLIPVEEIINDLVKSQYRGAISIEHEPEDMDPGPDCQRSHEKVKGWIKASLAANTEGIPVGVAIVGCGNISKRYAEQINSYPHVRLIGAQDIDPLRASELTTEFGGRVYDTLEEVLADEAVEVVVNLTIHQVHAEIIRKCLQAGKHVHTEKPLALSSKEAWDLVALARKVGLRLSSAPTTWLGEAQQTALRKIREGAIGTPRVVYAEVNWGRIESWHPNPAPFYEVGVLFDVAVYPLTLLTAWFGPVIKVTAGGGIVFPNRLSKSGEPFRVSREDFAAAVVEFESGVICRVTGSFYVGWASKQHGLEVHGDEGTLLLDRWDTFDAPLWIANPVTSMERWRMVPDAPPAEGIEFARGLSDLAQAIREDRPHKTTGAHAAHVVEIVEAIRTSIREGRLVELQAPPGLQLPV